MGCSQSLFYFHGKISRKHKANGSSTVTKENEAFSLLLRVPKNFIFILF